jgi:hypothetical protein
VSSSASEPIALTDAHRQARELAEAGDLTGARALLEEELEEAGTRWGRDDLRLTPLLVDLATIARNIGNLTEAQNQLRRAYGIATVAAGPEDQTSLSIEGQLAAVSNRLGEPTEAYDWHLRDAGPRVLGADHPAVRGALQRLAATAPAVDEGGWAPPEPAQAYEPDEYEPAYLPVPRLPGVYQRRGEATAPPEDNLSPEVITEETTHRPYRSRRVNPALVVIMTAGLAILIAAGVIATKLFDVAGHQSNGGAPEGRVTATSPTNPPPSNVKLVDGGGSVTLTWTDPSGGTVPFIVAGGRIGAADAPYETVPPGRTTSTIYGLNDKFDYCFTVAAVWSSTNVERGERVCTTRLSTGGAPSVPITISNT